MRLSRQVKCSFPDRQVKNKKLVIRKGAYFDRVAFICFLHCFLHYFFTLLFILFLTLLLTLHYFFIASFIAYVTKGDRDNPGEIDHPYRGR